MLEHQVDTLYSRARTMPCEACLGDKQTRAESAEVETGQRVKTATAGESTRGRLSRHIQ